MLVLCYFVVFVILFFSLNLSICSIYCFLSPSVNIQLCWFCVIVLCRYIVFIGFEHISQILSAFQKRKNKCIYNYVSFLLFFLMWSRFSSSCLLSYFFNIKLCRFYVMLLICNLVCLIELKHMYTTMLVVCYVVVYVIMLFLLIVSVFRIYCFCRFC